MESITQKNFGDKIKDIVCLFKEIRDLENGMRQEGEKSQQKRKEISKLNERLSNRLDNVFIGVFHYLPSGEGEKSC